jgi:hypothetical protein
VFCSYCLQCTSTPRAVRGGISALQRTWGESAGRLSLLNTKIFISLLYYILNVWLYDVTQHLFKTCHVRFVNIRVSHPQTKISLNPTIRTMATSLNQNIPIILININSVFETTIKKILYKNVYNIHIYACVYVCSTYYTCEIILVLVRIVIKLWLFKVYTPYNINWHHNINGRNFFILKHWLYI